MVLTIEKGTQFKVQQVAISGRQLTMPEIRRQLRLDNLEYIRSLTVEERAGYRAYLKELAILSGKNPPRHFLGAILFTPV